VLDLSFTRTGRACRIGVTGPPGAGKSTLVTRVTQEYRRRRQTVAVIAVDPTSPFSGGALLGDRVRMGELAGDPGVFIRSWRRAAASAAWPCTPRRCAICSTPPGSSASSSETVGVAERARDRADRGRDHVVLVPESATACRR